MSELIKEYLVWVIGLIFAIWQLIANISKKQWLLSAIIILLALSYCILGFIIINKNASEKAENRKIIQSLNSEVEANREMRKRDSLNRNADSLKDADLQRKLVLEFGILRDSSLNKPIQTTYNTHIEKARDVHIGPN